MCDVCCPTQAALSSLEREAKENVYAVLDPHIQYEITINKQGEPPKYLSLSKPLSHQRTHTFEPHNLNEINNNNDFNEGRFSTFKAGPPKAKRSRTDPDKNGFICKTNNDIEYSRDPYFGLARNETRNAEETYTEHFKNEHRSSKNYSRMYERNNSGRKDNTRKEFANFDKDIKDVRRASNRSRKEERDYKKAVKEQEKERSFEEFNQEANTKNEEDVKDYRPRPGKVREIASKFNRNSSNTSQKNRPKPLSYANQAYLDHVFPDAVEV